MPFDPNGLIEAISNGVSVVPSAIIAAVLLGGPTAIWLISRLAFPPDLRKPEAVQPVEVRWVCEACRSLNEDRLEACYHCHALRTGNSVAVLIDTGPPADPGLGIAVGPGRPAGQPVASSWLGGEFTNIEDLTNLRTEPDPPKAGDPSAAMFEHLFLDPAARTSEPAAAPPPPKVRRGRVAQGAGEANSKRNSRRPGS